MGVGPAPPDPVLPHLAEAPQLARRCLAGLPTSRHQHLCSSLDPSRGDLIDHIHLDCAVSTTQLATPGGPEMSFCLAEMGPPHHHPGHRMPHPGINEHPPWGGPQHPDFGPPPHGFNGQPPHMRRQGPPHINHDDPSLVPNVPYFDLPAGLMAPLVKVRSPW